MTDAETISATLIPKPLNVSALAKRHGVHRSTIQRRLKKGWTPPPELPLADTSRKRRKRRKTHAARGTERAAACAASPALTGQGHRRLAAHLLSPGARRRAFFLVRGHACPADLACGRFDSLRAFSVPPRPVQPFRPRSSPYLGGAFFCGDGSRRVAARCWSSLLSRLFIAEPCWRRTDIGGPGVVEGGSLVLVLQGHAPQLATHCTVRGEMGLARAYPGKFDKGDIGLHGYAPGSACASGVGGQCAIDKSARRIKALGWRRRSVDLAAAPAASRAVRAEPPGRPYWRQSRNLMTAVR